MTVLGILLIISGAALYLASVNVRRQQQALSDDSRYEDGAGWETFEDGQSTGRDVTDDSRMVSDDASDNDLMVSDMRQLSHFCTILRVSGFVLAAAGLILVAAGALL